MKTISYRIFDLSLLMLLASCGLDKHRAGIDPKPEVRAPGNISEAFVLEPRTVGPVKHGERKIGIAAGAFDKEFLMQASVLEQAPVQSFNGLKSRIVAFKHHGDQVLMIEASKGHTITSNLSQTLVLAAFPVTNVKDGAVYIDFNKGMSEVFASADLNAADFDGNWTLGWQSIKLERSFLDQVQLADNRLVIDQIGAIIQEPLGMGKVSAPIRLRYYLSPYNPDPDFVPTEISDFDHVGYFNVATQLQVNGLPPVIRASKFGNKKPVVFAVSATTPADYKAAVKDAVLYWNKVYGAELVQVIDAPEGVTAPDFNHNMIQWVDFDAAGFAYADAQMDPRSGEILHAQVFMTSAFAVDSKGQARRFLQQMEDTYGPKAIGGKKSKARKFFGLKGFEPSRLCDRDDAGRFAESLSAMLAAGASDKKILKASQDYVREVVAHEVGHTLGLRHNFAGSLGANYSVAQRDGLAKSYFDAGRAPDGVVATSSVMDYNAFEESIMTGDQIARGVANLAYDKVAVGHLYKGEKLNRESSPLFCTDSHAESFADCVRFDVGASPVEMAQYVQKAVPDSLVSTIFQWIVVMMTDATTPHYRSVDAVDIVPEMFANALVRGTGSIFETMGDSVKLIRIHRKYPHVTSLNSEEVREKQAEFLKSEIEKFGGFEALVAPFDLSKLDGMKVALKAFARSHHSGATVIGKPYDLSETDIAAIDKLADKLFDGIRKAMPTAEMSAKTGLVKLSPAFEDYGVAEHLGKRTMEIVMGGSDGKDMIVGDYALTDGGAKVVTVPVFSFSNEQRMQALQLLGNPITSRVDFGLDERIAVQKALRDLVTTAFGESSEHSIEVERIKSPELRRWFLENKALLSNISVN